MIEYAPTPSELETPVSVPILVALPDLDAPRADPEERSARTEFFAPQDGVDGGHSER
jgi:hypothetical protein